MIPYSELHAIIRTASNAWLRRGVPVDRDDLMQEAWCVALSTIPALERRGAPAGPYLGRSLINSLGRSIAEWTSSVSLSKYRRPMPDSTRPSNLRPEHKGDWTDQGFSPEEGAILAEWSRRLTAEINRLSSVDGAIMRALMQDQRPGEVAQALGLEVRQIYRCRNDFVRRLKAESLASAP